MRAVSIPLRLYAVSLAAAAVCLFGLALAGPLQAAPVLGESPLATKVVLALTLTPLAILSGLFPIQVARQVKVSVVNAALFAAVLLLGSPWGAGVAAASVAGHNAVLWARRRRLLVDLVVNSAQALVTTTASALAAGLAASLIPPPGQLPAAACVAAVAMYLTNKGLVRLAVALATGASFWRLYWLGIRTHVWQEVALFLLGTLAALNAPQYPWVLLLVAFPTAIVYFSFKTNQQLRTQTREAVEQLADVVDMRDPYTFGHCQRVAALSARLAERLGLPPDEVELVRSAARVHDIGKIGVPDYVLLKQGKLEPDEWAQMQRHPDIGADVLAKFPDYVQGRELVRDHHERHDGDGYPRHLAPDKTPLGARIIAAADAYDAMTSQRPYRPALSPPEAVDELRRHRGRQWDGQVADALISLLEEDTRQAESAAGLPAPGRLAAAGGNA